MSSETASVSGWIDSHCHLSDVKYREDVAGVIERARANGVTGIVAAAEDLASARRSVEIARGRDEVWPMAGLHPHHADRWSPATADELETMLRDPAHGFVAVGECGLDFYYDNAERPAQREAFAAQVELARQLGLPLVMHCREAYDEFVELAVQWRLGEIGGVVHCFGGDVGHARRLVDMGLYLGIAGVVTFKKAEGLRDVVRAVPAESLLIETDAPYLAPEPRRGRRNEPALMVHTAERIAAEKSLAIEDLCEITRRNTKALFGR